MKKTLIALTILITPSIFSVAYAYESPYRDMSWAEVKKQTWDKINEAKQTQTKNTVFKLNQRINEIEASKRTQFTIKKPQIVDVWVRESFVILENSFVIKNAPTWKKILIKQKNVWEY